jgi:AcrR family transcriptional regulator
VVHQNRATYILVMSAQVRRRGRPSGSSVDPETRRNDLLDAAEQAIAAGGPRVGLAAVAREAGYTRTAVYATFSSRDALLAALSKRHTQRLFQTIDQRSRALESPRERVSAFLDTLCEWIENHTDLYRALSDRALMGGDDAHGIFEEVAAVVQVLLEGALIANGAKPDAAAPWSRAMIGATAAAVEWWIHSGTMTRAELVAHLTELCWGGGMAMPGGWTSDDTHPSTTD